MLDSLIGLVMKNTTFEKLVVNVPSIENFKTLGDSCFMIVAPKLWNALPQELREETNVDIFKNGLKTYLSRKHFNC